ncbi:P-loop containing nucleoside triphosphate hydrolase protein [Mycena sp. CBHHK59/15]|nr:P-loop containing nucleoside triphosphate hydrolase protein [Mycena sp. CBHHK59/15]
MRVSKDQANAELFEGTDNFELTSSTLVDVDNLASTYQQRKLDALRKLKKQETGKILILDEATSAIDYKTDSIIQNSLRQELQGDVSLITVAHRLQTIMEADKIMVLDAGTIVEFDSPRELLKIEGGKLRALVEESGDKDALFAMAGAV